MHNLIKSTQCVIIPEIGENKDNFYYVGPIVREIHDTKEEYARNLNLIKNNFSFYRRNHMQEHFY